MHLSVTVVALLALGLMRCSSAARAFLELPSNLWERSNTQIKCTSETEGSNYFNIKEGRFWKVDSPDVYFEYAKPCSTNQFTEVNDTTGRISFLNSFTIPTWLNLTSADTGSYQCSLVSCLTNETQVSDSVAMTVHKYNTAPTMSEPTKNFYKFANDSENVTFTCEGYTGYPPGSMSVINEQVYSDRRVYNVLYANMTTDELGYAQQSVQLPITFVGGPLYQYFYCQTYKSIGSSDNTWRSNQVSVYVEYPPVINYVFKSSYYPDKNFAEDNITVTLTQTGRHYVYCMADSRPSSIIYFRQAGGNYFNVYPWDDNSYYIQVYYLDKQLFVLFQCDVEYASTVNPAVKFKRTGIVNVIFEPDYSTTTHNFGIKLSPDSFCLSLMLAVGVVLALLK